jgi:hypothetical protein
MQFDALRLAALAALMTSGLAVGCTPPDDSGGGGGDDLTCATDRDCKKSGTGCDKTNDGDDIPAANDPEGVCVSLVCITNADCADPEEEVCDVRRGFCVPKNLCDPGDADACSNPEERCVYSEGRPRCAVPADAATCSLVPSVGFVAVGGALQLEGIGVDGQGKLVPHTRFTFSGAGVSSSGLVEPTAAGVLTVTAEADNGGARCNATVNVYDAVDANDLRVVVIDQATREPLADVPVAIKVGNVTTSGETGDDGSYTFEGGAGANAVSAFPQGFQWHTILEPGNDVVLYTSAVATATLVDGVKGRFDFSKVHTDGEIRLGLAGTAINAAITDLNFDAIIGELVPTELDLQAITGSAGVQEVPLPEGLVIGLADQDFKPNYAALSTNNGPSVAWALGGMVRLSKIGPIITSVAGASDDINAGAILSAVLPFFASFDHAIVTGLQFTPAARNREGGDPNFQELTMAPDTLLMLSADYDLPELPCAPKGYSGAANDRCGNSVFKIVDGEEESLVNACPASLPATATCEPVSSYTSGVVVLSGVVVPGQGLVPLGISAALDDADGDSSDEFDGVAAQSGADGEGDDGVLSMDYAPPHDGVEGNLYVTVAIALDINSITGASDLGASILTKVSREMPTRGNAFPAGAFLESQGGTFFSGATGSFTLAKKGNADFYRVNLDDGGEAEWNVWFDADHSDTIDIAALPVAPGVSVGSRTVHADVQAFKLDAGYEGAAPASFADLMAFDGQDLDNLLYYLGGWSSESCRVDGLCDAQ